MVKYVITALCSVLSTGIFAGLPMYARFVAMETTITVLAKSVDSMTTQIQELKIAVTELRVEQRTGIKGLLTNGPTED